MSFALSSRVRLARRLRQIAFGWALVAFVLLWMAHRSGWTWGALVAAWLPWSVVLGHLLAARRVADSVPVAPSAPSP